MADGNIKVSIEKIVHNALRQCLQDIWDTHGLCVRNISATWVDISTHEEARLMLSDLETDVVSKR